MDKLLISLLIIGAVFIFVLGGGAGVLYQTQKDAPQLQKIEDLQSVMKKLSSKVVPSLITSGQVIKIEGRDITLSSGGDSITVKVKNDALVYTFVADSEGVQKQQQVDFSAIKKDSNINISSNLLADGSLEGKVVIIIPPVSTTTVPVK